MVFADYGNDSNADQEQTIFFNLFLFEMFKELYSLIAREYCLKIIEIDG